MVYYLNVNYIESVKVPEVMEIDLFEDSEDELADKLTELLNNPDHWEINMLESNLFIPKDIFRFFEETDPEKILALMGLREFLEEHQSEEEIKKFQYFLTEGNYALDDGEALLEGLKHTLTQDLVGPKELTQEDKDELVEEYLASWGEELDIDMILEYVDLPPEDKERFALELLEMSYEEYYAAAIFFIDKKEFFKDYKGIIFGEAGFVEVFLKDKSDNYIVEPTWVRLDN